MNVDFPYVETVIRIQRDSTAFKEEKDRLPGYYISSIPADALSPEQWMDRTREHWGGIEIRNHWRKDACLFEDKCALRSART
jgi:hypothetical protein